MRTILNDFTVVIDLLYNMDNLPAFIQIPFWRPSSSSPLLSWLSSLIPAAPCHTGFSLGLSSF